MTDQLENNMLAGLISAFDDLRIEQGELDDDGLCNFYLRTINQADADEAKIKEMAAAMLKDVERRRKALAYVYGEEFQRKVTEKLAAQGGKSKTVKFLMGTAGAKKIPAKIVFDPDQHAKAVSWASGNLDEVWVGTIAKTPAVMQAISTLAPDDYAEAVASMLKTPFKKHLETTGEIPPGVDVEVEHEGFHINGKVQCLSQLIETVRAELEPALDAPVTVEPVEGAGE